MSSQFLQVPNNDCLADELCALGVYFLRGGKPNPEARVPVLTLLSGLAASDEARLRLAIIPLLLQYPEYATEVRAAVAISSSAAQLTLKSYYTAAVFLQKKYIIELQTLLNVTKLLPDLFSLELGIPCWGTPDEHLQLVAQCQALLTGSNINWYGTYEHAVGKFISILQHLKACQA